MNKITLITPPDFFENSNPGILLIGLNDQQQDQVSEWLSGNDFKSDLNLYYYQGEDTLEWLLYALARAKCVYINADSDSANIQIMLSYIVSRSHVWYTTEDRKLRQVFDHLSGHYVNSVTDFFESIFNE